MRRRSSGLRGLPTVVSFDPRRWPSSLAARRRPSAETEARSLASAEVTPVSGGSEEADLPQKLDLIIEQILLHDLAVLPASHRAELEVEALVGRRMHLAVQTLPGANHLPPPSRDGARPIARGEHHLVGIVIETVLD